MKVRRALISVTDKREIARFADGLASGGVEILSSGGTGKVLAEAEVPFTEIAEYVGFPELLGGRLKTLHPLILGGILYRRGHRRDEQEIEAHCIRPLDLVVVNLYAFEETVARGDIDPMQAVEAIDIGGPSLIRAAAKNHAHVAVVTSPDQYAGVLEEIETSGGVDETTRRRLAADAFALTARYDRAIAGWFDAQVEGTGEARRSETFPESIDLHLTRQQSMRYGENPHQSAAFYLLADEQGAGLAACRQLHGKKLSFNNMIDADIALSLPCEFDRPCVAILKHSTPCGVAVAETVAEAEAAARACDPLSTFGGIIGMNRTCNGETASRISKAFTEVVIAPGYTEEALEILKKKRNLRLLETTGDTSRPVGYDLRRVSGGLLVQTRDTHFPEFDELRVVTRRKPTEEELAALRFAWVVCKYVKSNAVLFASEGRTLGLGAGQMSRVDAVHVAAWKAAEAGLDLKGSVLASDAFFPFPDGLEKAVEAGAVAVIQPGGSVRDQEVIDAADRLGVAMLFTGRRHFRHA